MENQEKPSITIQNVETLNIALKGHEPLEHSAASSLQAPVAKRDKKFFSSERIHHILDTSAKVVSVIAGLCLVALLALVLSGIRQIGVVQISSLLTIISATFIGGIFSIGGLNLISLQANLKKQKAIMKRYSIVDTLDSKILGSTSLTNGWHHFLFPSRRLLFVYGHECEAKIYKVDFTSLRSKCIWSYGEQIGDKTHFAQTAAHYKEDLLAVGDYSTGLVTIYDLVTLEWYTISPSRSVVSGLMFSPDGRYLLITYGHAPKNETVFVYHLDIKQTTSLSGSAPAVWINNSSIIMVSDNKALLRYDIEEKSEQIIHKSFRAIHHIASDGKIVVFAESKDETASEKQLTEIQLGRLDGFKPEIFTRMSCPLEQLEIFDSMLFVATSWNGSVSDTRRLRIFDLGGELISEFTYDSGHGHGYPKYAHLKSGDATFISTTGVNGYVPFVNISKRRRITINRDNDNNIKSMKETWISVQLDEDGEGHLYLSLLNHEGAFTLYEIVRESK